jgi:hypothetical protein
MENNFQNENIEGFRKISTRPRNELLSEGTAFL